MIRLDKFELVSNGSLNSGWLIEAKCPFNQQVDLTIDGPQIALDLACGVFTVHETIENIVHNG